MNSQINSVSSSAVSFPTNRETSSVSDGVHHSVANVPENLVGKNAALLQRLVFQNRHTSTSSQPSEEILRIKRNVESTSTAVPIDARSERNIQTLLLEKVQQAFRNVLSDLKQHFSRKGIDVVIISGNRSYTEQDALYAKGRPEVCEQKSLPQTTCSGNRVTNARGGYSNHNFGLAADIGLFQNGRYLGNSPFYKEIGPIVARHPQLEWGGNWKSFVDEPHIQYRVPYSMAQLRERIARNEAIV